MKATKAKTKTPKSKTVQKVTGKARLQPAAKITILKKRNPHRPRTGNHKGYALLKKGMTVGGYKKAGGRTVYLRRALRRKIIEVA